MTSIRRRLLGLFFGFLLIFLIVIGSLLSRMGEGSSLTVGAKNETEGQILSEIIAELIESELNIRVHRNFCLDGTFVIFNALKVKEIDLYVEYIGTALTAILKKDAVGISKEKAFEELREIFLKEYNILWMEPLGFQNTYALMMNSETSNKYGIRTLSDLKENGKEIRIGFDPEFYAREEMKILERGYEIPLQRLKLMDHSLLYLSLERGGLEVINGYSTDGFAKGLVILEDDKRLLPSYDAALIVHMETFNNFPKLEEVLKKLEGKFSVEEVQEMNYAVEKKGKSIYDVAHTFLNRHNLIHEFNRTDH